MTLFSYTLKTKSGHRETGFMEAITLDQATSILARPGYALLKLRPVSRLYRWIATAFTSTSFDLISFLKSLSLTLASGFDLISALNFSMPCGQSVLRHAVTTHLEQGYSLSEALKTYGICTKPLLLMHLKTAEETGRLQDALKAMVTYLQWEENLKKQVSKSMTYPLFVFGITVLLTAFLLLYVLPNLLTLFEVMGQPIPLETQILLSFGTYLPYGIAVIGFLILTIFFTYFGLKKGTLPLTPFRRFLGHSASSHKQKKLLSSYLQLMIFKPLSFIYGSKRIDFVGALEMVVELFPYASFTTHLQSMVCDIQQGKPIYQTMATYLYLDDGSTDLLRISEQTNHLKMAFDTLANTLEDNLVNRIQSLLKALGPTLLMVVGCILLTLVYTIILPLYGNLGAISR